MTILTVLIIWFAISIPVSLIAGRMLAANSAHYVDVPVAAETIPSRSTLAARAEAEAATINA